MLSEENQARMNAYADWLVANEGQEGSPDFVEVQDKYQVLREQHMRGMFDALSPEEQQIAQYKDNELGAYLRQKASAPREGETPEQTQKRLIGEIPSSGTQDSVPMKTARSVFQGVTGGLGDEIVGGLTAGLDTISGESGFNEAYEQRLAQERQKVEQFRETNPMLAYGGEIAGAIPTFYLAGTKIAQGGKALLDKLGPQVATKLDDLARTNPSLVNQIFKAMGIGGLEGGIYAFNQGEGGFENRAAEGGKGAVLGSVLGSTAPVLGKVASKGVDKARTFLAARREGLSEPAFRLLSRVLLNDDMLERGALRELQKSAPSTPNQTNTGIIADTSPSASQLLDVAVNRGGPASRQASNIVANRAAQTGKELKGTMTEILTPDVNKTLINGKPIADVIDETYRKAYATPINYATPDGKQLEKFIVNQVPRRALSEAAELMRTEGQVSQQYLFQFNDAGEVIGFRRMPDTREVDYITRSLNDLADATKGAGAMGGYKQQGASLKKLVSQMRNILKKTNPDYREALKLSGGVIRDREAYEFGLTALNKNVSRRDLVEQLETMGEGEAKKVAEAVRNAFDDSLENVELAMTDVNLDAREAYKAVKSLSSRGARQKLADILRAAHGPLKGGQLFRRFNKQFSRSLRALETRANLAQNSKTYIRNELQGQTENFTQEGAMNQALSGNPFESVKEIVRSVTGKRKSDLTNEVDEVLGEVATYLTQVRGLDAIEAVKRLRAIAPEIEEGAQQLGLRVGKDARTTLSVGAQPLPLEYQESELDLANY